ncbi:indole-3-glycerol phosphate synthase TrpC [Staphylococcus sp. SQ8-PEA]|uniref:Indole-3-glycerol phosphate synthase n=1 Tax=Staphylococcus marylandisciuri TaxID=2981529 RepID=A0ABT2QNL0_9STAP|nr:indole-3-glycerol phosphate synthase TrpC [Staphylococcus marylandisciuri]MCU5745564.1 indole-3-glycerol phosphate synthase TrpC [Staphylococcus marylandisciuri]
MTILDEIVSYKEELIREGYYSKKLTTLRDVDIKYKKPFLNRIRNSNTINIIAEIKSKSPSVKTLPARNLSAHVRAYERYGASAISILTDEAYFGGSFERLQSLSEETALPVLCKDFIIEPIQIDVAKKAGASIILLIVNILSDAQLKALYNYATEKGLEVLVEVHDEKELERAHDLQPEIIGVNNRDLHNFSINIEQTNNILKDNMQNCCYISESGIKSSDDVHKIINSGINGVLIGEALMKCENLEDFLPSLQLQKVKR